MKSQIRILAWLALIACLSPRITTEAATIWNGPLTLFTQATPYPGPGDRDQLTPKVALTRANPTGAGDGGLFNAVTETSFDKFVSPADTEWAVGSLTDYATLSYSDWTSAGGGSPVHNYPGEQLVVHLISDDIYLSLQFTALTSGPGFSYIRSTPPVAHSPPLVAITLPTNGAVFAAPANVAIQAAIINGSGAVTNVEFLIGSSILTNEAAAPFAATAGKLAAGGYGLSVLAQDNNGLMATNSIAISVVTPVLIHISSPFLSSQANIHFMYSANVGLQYFVQRSTNLVATNWLTIATNTAIANPMNFTDTNATANPGFYRVGRLPNP